MIELQACPLCKKEIKQLHSHLRNKHRLSAKERRPYMKIARESAVKHKNTVLTEINILTEFEEQKCSLDNDFKDIEDLIVTSYLKTKSSLPSKISIRKTIVFVANSLTRNRRPYESDATSPGHLLEVGRVRCGVHTLF